MPGGAGRCSERLAVCGGSGVLEFFARVLASWAEDLEKCNSLSL